MSDRALNRTVGLGVVGDGSQFNGSLFLGFDAQEESGNFSGIRKILHHAPKADICILGYQSFDEIAIGTQGWLRLKLTTHEKATRTGSRPKRVEMLFMR